MEKGNDLLLLLNRLTTLIMRKNKMWIDIIFLNRKKIKNTKHFQKVHDSGENFIQKQKKQGGGKRGNSIRHFIFILHF